MVQIDFILHNALQNKNEAKCKTALHKIDILAKIFYFFLNFRHFLIIFFPLLDSPTSDQMSTCQSSTPFYTSLALLIFSGLINVILVLR